MVNSNLSLSSDALLRLAQSFHASCQSLEPLPGYDDINALALDVNKRPLFVLKLSRCETDVDTLPSQFHNEAHAMRLAARAKLPVPHLLSVGTEQAVFMTDQGGDRYWARALSFLEGRPLAECIHSDRLMASLGHCLGKLTQALATLEPSTTDQTSAGHEWNLDRAGEVIAQHRTALASDEERAIVDAVLADATHFLSHTKNLPTSVIHGDVNDYNVLVGFSTQPPQNTDRFNGFEPAEITGLIDFGDLHHSSTVNEIAIAIAYAMFGASREHPFDPVAKILPLLEAYHQHYQLSDDEIAVLFPKTLLRLAVSVCSSAHQRATSFTVAPEESSGTDQAYHAISERDAWRSLRRFVPLGLSERERRAKLRTIAWRLRTACGKEPVPRAQALTAAIADLPTAPIITGEVQDYQLIDLSFGASSLVGYDSSNEVALTTAVSAALGYDVGTSGQLMPGERVGWGRYLEPRALYVGEQFRGDPDAPRTEARTVHIGVDLFATPGTAVHAPIDGVVHSFADNAIDNDYGPTLILSHTLGQDSRSGEESRFFTLYGHLSRESLFELHVGQPFAAGDKIAELGVAKVNGGWTPHLHFQILLDDLGLEGNYPGVCEASQVAVWRKTCPDPNLLLRWPSPDATVVNHSPSELIERRSQSLAPSLSLSFQRPLHITRGRGQWLYETNGHAYLDLVNNVSHVGHCHPHVTAAITQQVSTLNTNSRYLHTNYLDYAERLLATVPQVEDQDSIEVCFLVNSGSEANDLALRLARTVTDREAVICIDGGYHGNVRTAIDVSPYKHDGPGGTGTPAGVFKVPMPDLYRGMYRGPDAVERYADHIREIAERHPVAALIGEAILSCGGQVELPNGYLDQAYRSVRSNGGLVIADEVQVGFGRVGSHFWGFERHGVLPDIITCGKPMGNGHPLAAVLTTRRIAQAFANGMEYFNTYGGNPVSAAAGLAVLDVIETENLQERALELGAHFVSGLHRLKDKYSVIGDVRGSGLFLVFELVRDPDLRDPNAELAWYLAQWMRERGYVLSTDGPDHNVIKIKPPLVIERRDIDATLDELHRFFAITRNRATIRA